MAIRSLEGAQKMAAKNKHDVEVSADAVYLLRTGKTVYVKTADICAMTGKSNQWIGQLASQGMLNKRTTPHGSLYDLTETVRAYCGILENRAKEAAGKAVISLDKERLDAETSLKKSKAIKAELEANELTGKMHRSDDVADMTADLVYAIRGMLLALPGRLAIDAAASSDPVEVSALIRSEVYIIMGELAKHKYSPERYGERVRKRMNWDELMTEDDGDES